MRVMLKLKNYAKRSFPNWLKNNVEYQCNGIGSQLFGLAMGPSTLVKCYNGQHELLQLDINWGNNEEEQEQEDDDDGDSDGDDDDENMVLCDDDDMVRSDDNNE
ncbi:hypothetical protein D5086_005503 [Populus alba]|uniref:Uncharacterized protein n=1 Tax=Populus alba TaxID=43335 RepID=A0ACC4CTD0_POPAL